jgi:hypothetical protein
VRALCCFRDSLEPGGALALDVPAPELVSEPEPLRSWTAEPFVWTLQTLGVRYDAAANQTTRWLRYEKWRDGALVATELQQFRLQHWSITEFEGLLQEVGFTEVSVSGDYHDGRAPGPRTSVWNFRATQSAGHRAVASVLSPEGEAIKRRQDARHTSLASCKRK